MDPITRRDSIARHSELSIERQCELLEVSRSSYYYKPSQSAKEVGEFEDTIKGRLDYWHTKHPSFGVRKMRDVLREEGYSVGRKRIRRYMNEMGIYAVYPKPNLSKRNQEHRVYPYLLRNMPIYLPNQVWSIDITYIKMRHGHMYLTAIIDWYSRYIVGWELSDTLETAPVLKAVREAIETYGTPGIINSDQGSQFTSDEYTKFLKDHMIRQSMDGKARWVDNVVIERWFRSLKCEDIYLNEYETPRSLRMGIRRYVDDYNHERPHQSFDGVTPEKVYLLRFTTVA